MSRSRGAFIAPETADYKSFLAAVKDGDVDMVDMLLASHPHININAIDWLSYSDSAALHIAAARGDVPMVDFLLRCGAEVDFYTDNASAGLTPLHCATYIPVLERLLESGADINARGGNYWGTAAHIPFNSDVDPDVPELLLSLEFLIDRGLDLSIKDENGHSGLHCVARNGVIPIAKLYLDQGTDIDQTSYPGGPTALQLAVEENQLEMVIFLLSRGATITANMIAIATDYTEIFRELLSRADEAILLSSQNMVHNVISARPDDEMSEAKLPILLRILLESGVSVEAKCSSRNDYGGHRKTPLLTACSVIEPSIEIIRILLEHGADVNAEDDDDDQSTVCKRFTSLLELKSNILLVTFITLENYPLIHKLLQGRDRIRVGKSRHIR